ncbi:hypothetical protein Dsin_013682 [Dipteronia sinensis]|uniref:Uncharacterized protein n=1 Tax=Dipteronia sinensis TaxID=43782 RepID=A0AAE0E9N7_9ROSI|nr:hypothetical protein Dsin_013682 [Dipteronia sinensis]
MEKRRIWSLLVVICLVVGTVLAEQSSAATITKLDQHCFHMCLITCIAAPDKTVIECSLQCLLGCRSHSDDPKTPFNFCNLGCALSLCSDLISKKNPTSERQMEKSINALFRICGTSNGRRQQRQATGDSSGNRQQQQRKGTVVATGSSSSGRRRRRSDAASAAISTASAAS